MEGRGRRSAASLAVVAATAIPQRPDPPASMTAAQKAIWRDVVRSMPVDWFGPECLPVLKEYIRAAAMCDTLDAMIQKGSRKGSPSAENLKMLLDSRAKESNRVAQLAAKLRLTQQSRYTPKSAATAANREGAGRKPWQR